MRVRIDRVREERTVATGWFARTRIPAYCVYLAITFSEEERYLVRHAGLGDYVFFQAPIPPEITEAVNRVLPSVSVTTLSSFGW